jgi:hypothetical protein
MRSFQVTVAWNYFTTAATGGKPLIVTLRIPIVESV